MVLHNIVLVQFLRMQQQRWWGTSSGMMNFGWSGIICLYIPKPLKSLRLRGLWQCNGYARWGFVQILLAHPLIFGIIIDGWSLLVQFPFFCSDREYIIGRRIWESGRTFYCVTKVCIIMFIMLKLNGQTYRWAKWSMYSIRNSFVRTYLFFLWFLDDKNLRIVVRGHCLCRGAFW